MKIGIVFDIKEDYGIESGNIDYLDFCHLSEAESAKKNLELAGYETIFIGNPRTLTDHIRNNTIHCDIVYNISEGYKSRNREGLVPSLCESFAIPYTGTDAFGLSFTLHKYQTSCFLKCRGIPVANSFLFDPSLYNINMIPNLITWHKLNFPLILKPNHEGSSMGVTLVERIANIGSAIEILLSKYNQEIIIENFVRGPEISVCILGTGNEAYVLGIIQYRHLNGGEIDIFTNEIKKPGAHFMTTPQISLELTHRLEICSIEIHKMLGLRDFSRIDWKIKGNTPYFLEATPLPDMSEGTEFEWAAKQKGHSYSYVFDSIMKSAMKRYPELSLLPK